MLLKSITYSEGVAVALGIQHAMRMRRIAICGLTVPFFPRYLIKDTIFGKYLLNIKSVLILSITFV